MNCGIKAINGLQLVLADMPDANAVTIEVFAKAGSIYEQASNNGLSHFLEHMFFKGGKKYQTPAAVAQAVDEFGGEFNAYTSHEYAGYYITCAPRYTTKAIDILADMLVDAQFPKAEMEREKGVVVQEINMYEDNPQRLVRHKSNQWYYGNTPFGQSILGPAENVMSFSQDDLFGHKESLYCKDNIVIVLAGNIDKAVRDSELASRDDLDSMIGELFGSLPTSSSIQRPVFDANLPPEQQSSYHKETEQNHLVISANGFSMHDQDRYAAEVVMNLLGGTMSSRLFQNVREKRGLCYYIGSYHIDNVDFGAFKMMAGMDKNKWEEGLQAIYDEIADVANGNVTAAELQRVMGNIVGSTEMGIETSSQMAGFVGTQALFKQSIESLDEMLTHYEAVTMDDVIRVASLLSADKLYAYRVA